MPGQFLKKKRIKICMWQDILKGKKMALPAIKYINEVMSDGKKRTEREILDEMWKIVESHNDPKSLLTGKYIPTIAELRRYLSMNYSMGIFHNETGEELPLKARHRRNVARKYYR